MSKLMHDRKESMYFKIVSEIISNELTNANLSMTTVTGVKLTNDGSHLNIFVVFEDHDKVKNLEILERAKGYVRSQLARLENQRIVPQLHFKFDETYEKAKKIDEILEKIKKN